MPETSQTIPVAAARFDATSPFVFDQGEDADGVPVHLHARDAQPIYHWYWGKIAHDMSGCQHRDKIAIDWCHDADQLIGYVDDIKADSKKGLDLGGMVLSGIDDKAAEVVKKASAGVPYESSIDWTGPAVIEYVDSSTSVDVNGYTFEGPGYVVRQWNLRGVAICPHGADMSTSTEFSEADQAVGVTVFTQSDKGVVMPTNQPQQDKGQEPETKGQAESQDQQPNAETKPAETHTQDSAPATDTDRAEQGKRFADTFGEDHGPKYFAAGLSFENALAEHSKKLTAENATLKDSLDKLTKDVAGLREHAGDEAGASSTPEGTQDTPEQKTHAFGSPAIAAMAAKYSGATD